MMDPLKHTRAAYPIYVAECEDAVVMIVAGTTPEQWDQGVELAKVALKKLREAFLEDTKTSDVCAKDSLISPGRIMALLLAYPVPDAPFWEGDYTFTSDGSKVDAKMGVPNND